MLTKQPFTDGQEAKNLSGLSKQGFTNRQEEEFVHLVKRIVTEIEETTLSNITTYFGRLLYFASLRDCGTGQYYHDGIMARYSSEEAMHQALSICHSKAFMQFVNLSLEEQTQEVAEVFKSLAETPQSLVETWRRIRSYEILHPQNCQPIARELFARNFEIILKVLRHPQARSLLSDPHGNAYNLT